MYLLVKLLTHFTTWLVCKQIHVYNREATAIQTPLVIGCNHPNSFLDAILVGSLMKKRVHFLTRGDVFHKKWAVKLLQSVNMIPIYRIRDGKENLGKNDVTFELCRQVLQKGEDVLIFVEGFCNYQTTLQVPLKKGAPRLMVQGWADGVDVQLLPVWLRYHSFFDFPLGVEINFGKPFGKEVKEGIEETAIVMQNINKETEEQLQQLSTIHAEPKKSVNNYLLFLPAMLGVITHLLFFLPVKILANFFKGPIHYHSILFVFIAFAYPFYLAALCITAYCIFNSILVVAIVLLLPLLAKAYVLWK